ncbi:MAG: hypothetical protein IGS23_06980 [Rivularia sp. T60_A2020_040]|nr:hypothetical protein [Rivularia sp. T60_A2020_040]
MPNPNQQTHNFKSQIKNGILEQRIINELPDINIDYWASFQARVSAVNLQIKNEEQYQSIED